jgi:hypothetical protein
MARGVAGFPATVCPLHAVAPGYLAIGPDDVCALMKRRFDPESPAELQPRWPER